VFGVSACVRASIMTEERGEKRRKKTFTNSDIIMRMRLAILSAVLARRIETLVPFDHYFY